MTGRIPGRPSTASVVDMTAVSGVDEQPGKAGIWRPAFRLIRALFFAFFVLFLFYCYLFYLLFYFFLIYHCFYNCILKKEKKLTTDITYILLLPYCRISYPTYIIPYVSPTLHDHHHFSFQQLLKSYILLFSLSPPFFHFFPDRSTQ